MHQFSRGELSFPLLDSGPEDAECIVLLHGFPQGPSSWEAVVPFLEDAGFRVIVPTLRGYAASNRPPSVGAYRLEELTADIAALVAAAGADRVHLVGHDWGAVIAWATAERYPELLHTVTGVSVPPIGAWFGAMSNPRQLRASWYVGAFMVPWLTQRLMDPSHRFGRAFFGGQLRRAGQSRGRVARDLDLLADRAGIEAAIAYYRANRKPAKAQPTHTPALFVWSTGDTAITSSAARAAGKFVAGPFRSVTLPGVSHWIPEEAPDVLANLVLEHVGEPHPPVF